MTTIVIKDLNESREMDREAMRAVRGGSTTPQASRISQNKPMLLQQISVNLTSQRVDVSMS